jgi:hypothetical protein
MRQPISAESRPATLSPGTTTKRLVAGAETLVGLRQLEATWPAMLLGTPVSGDGAYREEVVRPVAELTIACGGKRLLSRSAP